MKTNSVRKTVWGSSVLFCGLGALCLAVFTAARNRNIEKLRSVGNADWKRRGVQYGIGSVALEDIPRMMAEHDRGHTAEIAALLAHIREGKPYEAPRASAVA